MIKTPSSCSVRCLMASLDALRSIHRKEHPRALSVLAMTLLLVFSLASLAPKVQAADGDLKLPPALDWSFDGPFGHFDKAQLQRGFKIYRQVCASCHALKNVAFRHMGDLGYNQTEIRAIAAEYQIGDGPDDEGNMFLRAGIPSDYLPNPYENDAQARAINNGAYPVNLSTVVRARQGGADYIAALLTGYADPPADVSLDDGQYYNVFFDGNVLAMAEQLSDGLVEFDDDTPLTAEQYAKDVTAFLVWANEPSLIVRKQLGAKVIIFLVFMLMVTIAYQRYIWRRAPR